MAKKQKSDNRHQIHKIADAYSRQPHDRKIYIVGGAIVVILLGWLLVHLIQLHVERSHFIKAEAELHSLTQQIISQSTMPTKQISVRSCTYQHRKYGSGDRSCEVSELSIYNAANKNTAMKLKGKLELLLRDNSQEFTVENTASVPPQAIDAAKFSVQSLNHCGASYTYLSTGESANYAPPTLVANRNEFIVQYVCFGSAKSNYFPVQP